MEGRPSHFSYLKTPSDLRVRGNSTPDVEISNQVVGSHQIVGSHHHSKDLEQDSFAGPLRQPSPDREPPLNPPFDIVSQAASQATSQATSQAAELLDLSLPSHSPPLQADLFIHSAFSTAAPSKGYGIQTILKPVARLETVIHTDPETLKDHLRDFGSRASDKGVEAVVQERKENGEYVVAYKMRVTEVRKCVHARALSASDGQWGAGGAPCARGDQHPHPPPLSPRQLLRCNRTKTGSRTAQTDAHSLFSPHRLRKHMSVRKLKTQTRVRRFFRHSSNLLHQGCRKGCRKGRARIDHSL